MLVIHSKRSAKEKKKNEKLLTDKYYNNYFHYFYFNFFIMYKLYTLYTHRRKTMCKANDIPSTEQNNSVTAMRN